MEAQDRDGFDGRDMLPVDAHGLRQDNDEGDLTDLAGLHVDGHARQVDPAALAGGAGDAEGDDQQQGGPGGSNNPGQQGGNNPGGNNGNRNPWQK